MIKETSLAVSRLLPVQMADEQFLGLLSCTSLLRRISFLAPPQLILHIDDTAKRCVMLICSCVPRA